MYQNIDCKFPDGQSNQNKILRHSVYKIRKVGWEGRQCSKDTPPSDTEASEKFLFWDTIKRKLFHILTDVINNTDKKGN